MVRETHIIKLELADAGEIQAELTRILSPITISRLIKEIFENKQIITRGRFFIGGRKYFMISLNIKKGAEKAVNELSKGDVAYDPSSDSLMIALVDGKTRMKVNKLGCVISGLEVLEKVQRGCGVKITEK